MQAGMRTPVYYGYWLIGASFLAQFVSIGIYSYVLSAFMVPMCDELGWTRAEYTIARSVGQVVMALTGFCIGAQVDRLGGRPLMGGGPVVVGAPQLAHS
jgi:hypothetical protein